MNGSPTIDPAAEPRVGITARPASVAWVLGSIALVLVLASVTGQLILYLTAHDHVLGLPPLFDVDRENSLPAAYSVFLLLFAAQLLAFIALLERRRRGLRWYWAMLAAGFLYMAFDEMVALHERLTRPVRELIGGDEFGIFYFAWVVPALLLVPVLGLIFLRFLLRLPPRTRRFMALAGSIFVGGALGIELIGGLYAETHGMKNLGYKLLTTVEESLEMAGVIVFIWTLLDYLSATHREPRLRFGSAPPTSDG
jgi:hypothetical protein